MPDVVASDKKCENNLTISTKLSTDNLISKSPEGSPNLSLRQVQEDGSGKRRLLRISCLNSTLYLGVFQVVLGILMTVFGALVIIHNANLSQVSKFELHVMVPS